jgi:hypothetical protein
MTELKMEISGYDLVEAILEDGDLLDRREFDDAVKAIVEDEIDRKVEKEVDRAINDYDFREIVPTVTINEQAEAIEILQRQVEDLESRMELRCQEIEDLKNFVGKRLMQLEHEKETIRNSVIKLQDNINLRCSGFWDLMGRLIK